MSRPIRVRDDGAWRRLGGATASTQRKGVSDVRLGVAAAMTAVAVCGGVGVQLQLSSSPTAVPQVRSTSAMAEPVSDAAAPAPADGDPAGIAARARWALAGPFVLDPAQLPLPRPPLRPPPPRTPDPTTTKTDTVLVAAYRKAAAAAPAGCHVTVGLLAAIGQVESGSLGGRSLDSHHRVVPAVLGPVLDGGAFAAIRDTDGGRLDGNTVWDRAVGPMQFIPGTWAHWGRDGDGDKVADPQNVFDAAVTTGAYLCAGGRDLARPADLVAAIRSYNNSAEYVAVVRQWSAYFATFGLAGLGDVSFLADSPTASASTSPSTTSSATTRPTSRPTGPSRPSTTTSSSSSTSSSTTSTSQTPTCSPSSPSTTPSSPTTTPQPTTTTAPTDPTPSTTTTTSPSTTTTTSPTSHPTAPTCR